MLLAGDGDFKDMVEFLTETLYKRVWILGYRTSLSASLFEKATPGCVLFIDDIWQQLSVPLQKQEPGESKKTIEKIIWSPEIESNKKGEEAMKKLKEEEIKKKQQ